jgi:deoxyribodipyrimidine photo-lyase
MLDLGFRKTGYQRYLYLKDTLQNLRESYQKIGGNLLILFGKPEELLPELIKTHQADKLIYQKEIMSEETSVESQLEIKLESTPCKITTIWGKTLYHLDDLPFEVKDIPLTSKAFRINTSKNAEPRAVFPTPTSMNFIQLDDYGDISQELKIGFTEEELQTTYDEKAFPAGETAALQRLQYYTFDSNLVETYKWTRNKSLGVDFSSKLSAYLALGSLSPRLVYFTVKDYETQIKRNISTWWLVFEVVWRDYFNFLGMREGNKVFFQSGYLNKKAVWTENYELFDRWKNGTTGIPFVDAHMKQLSHSGFMSNRGRVNTASFLSYDYQVDWRWGAAWFESLLIDHDVCSNWFNWNTQALHIYYTNPVHQSLKYDKNADFISSELHYLNKLPKYNRHAPWLLSDSELEKLGVEDYSRPFEIYKKWNRSIINIEKLIDK